MTCTDRHTIKATFEQETEGTVTSEIEVVITFKFIPASGDGWNDPREPEACEFVSITHEPLASWMNDDERRTAEGALWDWADQWVDDHQAECLEVVRDYYEAAREYAADLRRDRT